MLNNLTSLILAVSLDNSQKTNYLLSYSCKVYLMISQSALLGHELLHDAFKSESLELNYIDSNVPIGSPLHI
jgi:hypothetical protein